MKGLKLFLAICWSVVMVGNIVECSVGLTPSWFDVFCPLVVVVIDSWLDWLTTRK